MGTVLANYRSDTVLKLLLIELTQELHLKFFWYMKMEKSYVYQETPITIALNNYPKEFAREYLDGKRFTRDPVLYSSFNQSCRAACWNEIIDTSSMSDKFQEQLEWVSQFKIKDGISCPIHGPGSEFAWFHFATDDNCQYSQGELGDIKDSLSILAPLIHEKIRTVVPPTTDYCRVNLANREFECLLWAARGKTIWETSRILKLAESTTREYMTNCMTKLNVSNKTEAVTKAMLLGLLKYTDIVVS